MAEKTLLGAALLCALAGMGWFALAMEPHWRQVRGDAYCPRRARRLRLLAALSLLGSLASCLAADHVSMAPLVWVMALSASALGVALSLAYRPHWLRWLVIGLRVEGAVSTQENHETERTTKSQAR